MATSDGLYLYIYNYALCSAYYPRKLSLFSSTTPVYQSTYWSRSRFTKSVTIPSKIYWTISAVPVNTLLSFIPSLFCLIITAEWPSCSSHYRRVSLGLPPVGWNTSVPRIISLRTSLPSPLLIIAVFPNSCLSYDRSWECCSDKIWLLLEKSDLIKQTYLS